MALREHVPEQLAGLLTASHPELRAAAVFTLGALVQVHPFCPIEIFHHAGMMLSMICNVPEQHAPTCPSP